MSQMIQAVYEDGVFKPLQELVLGEHQQVRITVESQATAGDPADWENMVGKQGDVPSVVVPIITLEPEPFDLLRSIPVVVQPTDDGYLATFFDANIGITGDTKEESVANLRLLLVDVFDELEREEAQLGPQLIRQLAVLRGFMKRRV
jgi:predicted DNA-binding antitoxin AbrB/MazE fold protein